LVSTYVAPAVIQPAPSTAPAADDVQPEEVAPVTSDAPVTYAAPIKVEAAPVPWAYASSPAACAAPVTYPSLLTYSAPPPVEAVKTPSSIIAAPTVATAAVATPTATRAVNPVVVRKGCC
jgi:hypothetical protein